MSSIEQFLQSIRTAIFARTVRNDIANAIEQCYDDVHNPTLNTEAIQAAVQAKIDAGQMAALTIGDRTITAVKLALGVIPTPDTTLSQSSVPADAKKTGDEITTIRADLGDLSDLETESKTDLVSAINEAAQSGLSDTVKQALLACFENVTFKPGTGRQYYNELQTALYGFPRLRILFNPGSTQLYVSQNVADLKQYMTVYYQESAKSSEELIQSADYTLTGVLNNPVNALKVEYNECIGYFYVNVDAYHYIKGANFSWGYGSFDVYEEMPAMYRGFKYMRTAITYGEALDGYDINTSGVATRVSYLRSMLVPAGSQQVSAQLSGSNVSLYQVSYVGFAADKVTKVLESSYATPSTAVSLPNTVRYLFMNIKKSNNADMTQTDLNTTGTITFE